MIINFDNYIKEGVKYLYPYQRIMVLINSIDEFHTVYNYIEKTFNISITRERSDEMLSRYNLTHVLICVDTIYDAIENNNYSVNEYEILCFYTLRRMNIDSMLDEIKQERMVSYINFDDILTIDEIKSIEPLIKYGIKYLSYNNLYKNKENVYESLLSKISGPTFDEVFNDRESFRIKINSKEEFENYLDYFNKKGILGEFITIGTAMRNYIISDEIKYYKRWKEFSLSIEPLSFAKLYTGSFGDYNIFLAINTIDEIREGDVVPLILDDTTKLEYYVNKLISKASDINDDVNESLLDKISGPTNDDVLNDVMKRLNIIDLDRTNAEKLLQYGISKKIPYIIKYVSEKFNIFNQSGLYVLMMNNDIEYVEKYFKKGFRFKFLNQYGDFAYRTPLYDALKTSPEMFKLIYKYHKEISKKILNELLIENYSFVHDLSYFDVLFELGADVHFNNDSMIKKMIEYRKIKIIKQLLERFDFSRNTIVFCIELAHRTSKSQIEAVFTDYKNNKYL